MASRKLPTGSGEQELLDNSVSHTELPPCKPLLVPPFSFLFVFLLLPPRGQGLVGRKGFLSAFFCFGPRTHIQIQKLNGHDATLSIISFSFFLFSFHFLKFRFILFIYFFFCDRVSSCSPGCQATHSVDQTVCLCWNLRRGHPCPDYCMCGNVLPACMSTTCVHPEISKRGWISWNWSFRWLWATTWVLETKRGPFQERRVL